MNPEITPENSDPQTYKYGPTPETTEPQKSAPVPEPKKSSKKKIILYIVLVIVVAVLAGGGVWFYMNQQLNSRTSSLKSQITAKDETISTLNDKIAKLDGTSDTTASATLNTNATTSTDDITSLKTACLNLPSSAFTATTDNKLQGANTLYYANVENVGTYGGCAVSPTVGAGGFYRILKKVNGSWVVVSDAQNASRSYIQENNIPVNVVISHDAYNLISE